MSMLLRWFQRITAVFTALTSFIGIGSKTVTISLYTMPSSGYSWSYTYSDDDVLVCSDSYYKENISIINRKNDGKQYFVFKAKNPGTVTVTFQYKNSSGDVASTYVYTYTVNSKGRIKEIK